MVNTSLAFFEQEDLSIYLIINIISFLVLTMIFTPSNPEAKKKFNTLNMIFFTGFLGIVIIKFLNIINV
jgi:hypothetical protein